MDYEPYNEKYDDDDDESDDYGGLNFCPSCYAQCELDELDQHGGVCEECDCDYEYDG